LAGGKQASPALVAKLRRDLSDDRAHLVVEQVELRRRAKDKFALAERLFFTRKGLEQSTDEQVAAAKAARFPSGQPLADLCCGIGGDLIALAARGSAVGVERDPAVRLLAECNLRAHGRSAEVQAADAADFDVASRAAWHVDPDRRPAGRRTTRAELFEPTPAALDRLLDANPNAAIKLAPAAVAPARWRHSAELCWLGSRGECRQQVAWFGALTRHPGERSASVVDAHGGERTIVGSADEPIPTAALGRYLYEPHAAVLAAKLTGALCGSHSLAAVSAGVAYLTADVLIDEPACDAFVALDVLPLDQKRLRAWCRQRGIGRLEVKKRGVDIDPERLRKSVAGQGDEAATLIVAPLGGQVRVIVARRVNPPPPVDPAA
jgi:hypothetical protein